MRAFLAAAVVVCLSACRGGGADASQSAPEKLHIEHAATYSGMADASAGVAVSSNLFIVADDEDNKLRLYRADQPGPPVKEFDMAAFLQVQGKSLESEL